jgi:dihydropteroate synthase
VDFDVSNRMSVVREVVDESSNKVLIFVPFTHTIALLNGASLLRVHDVAPAMEAVKLVEAYKKAAS